MKILILDDDAGRHQVFDMRLPVDAVHTKTALAAWEAIEHERFHVWFLDHDLELTDTSGRNGQFVTDAFLRKGKPAHRPLVAFIHSQNAQGADNMKGDLEAAGVQVVLCPFGSQSFKNIISEFPSDVDGLLALLGGQRIAGEE